MYIYIYIERERERACITYNTIITVFTALLCAALQVVHGPLRVRVPDDDLSVEACEDNDDNDHDTTNNNNYNSNTSVYGFQMMNMCI